MVRMDKFAGLAALRPVENVIVHEERPPAEESPDAGVDECTLARLLGATIFSTKYGNHLSIRNWYATPEFPEGAPAALDLLRKTQDAARTKQWRAAAGEARGKRDSGNETHRCSRGARADGLLIRRVSE